MATIIKRPRSRFWRAMWRDANGRLRGRSTKQTSRAKALRLALEFERLDRELREGRMAAQQAQRVIGDVVRELGLVVEETPTIRAWFDGWVSARDVRDSTLLNYRKATKDLMAFLGADADKPLPTLTTDRLQTWVKTLVDRELAAGTIKIYLDPIKGASTRAWKSGHLSADVASGLELPRVVNAKREAFTAVEIDGLLAHADDDWRIVILAGAYAGLRISDAAGLTWDKVDLAAGVIRTVQQKTGEPILIPIHPRLRSELERHAGDDPTAPLCPNLRGLDTRGTHGLSGMFKKIMRRAGIGSEERGTGQRKVSSKSAHSLRHTFVRRLLAAGVDEAIRMKLAGHASKSAHQVYAQAEIDLLRKAVEALP